MSRRRPSARPTVAFFGEDLNDCEALRILFRGIRPDLDRYTTRTFRKPLTLVKGLDRAKQQSRQRSLSKFLDSIRCLHDVVVVVLHEDADAVEPAHEAVIKLYQDNYADVGCIVLAAVPAWETEAWWFLFPDAVVATNPSWRRPDDYTGRNTGKITNAKETLIQKVRPARTKNNVRRVRDYEESDSPRIAMKIVELDLLRRPCGSSASWRRFVDQVIALRL